MTLEISRALVVLFAATLLVAAVACPTKVGKCYMFPPNDEINRPIANDPVDYMSPCIMKTFVGWGDKMWLASKQLNEYNFGLPHVTTRNSPLVPVTIVPISGTWSMWRQSSWFDKNHKIVNGRDFPESATQPTDMLANIPQKLPLQQASDSHALVLDSEKCTLTETWLTSRLSNGFKVGIVKIFDLKKNLPQHPDGEASANAAGLPMTPMLLKYSEVQSGAVRHAISLVASYAQAHTFVHPATASDGLKSNPMFPWYGARFRLKKSFPTKGYSKKARIIFTAMKTYGVIFTDQGNLRNVGIVADTHPGFAPLTVELFKKLRFRNFEMVQSPNPVITHDADGNAVPFAAKCGAKTANVRAFKPNWNPKCPSL